MKLLALGHVPHAGALAIPNDFRQQFSRGTERDGARRPRGSTDEPADFLAAEMSERLARGPATFRVLVQLAEAGDEVANSTAIWPETRTLLEFGTLAITQRVDELAPERRKIIFDPLPRVDGIDSAGDPLTSLRADLYLQSGRRRRAATAK